MIAKRNIKTARYSRNNLIKPRMNTDKHGLRQSKRSLQRTRKAFLMGEPVCMAEILFLSVSISVNPWLKVFLRFA